MQVIAKGTTRRCVDNRHLPPEIAAHFSASGWQTESTFIRAIDDVLIPHLGPEGGVLVVDKYSAHLTDKVRVHCNENHIDLIEVPAHDACVAAARHRCECTAAEQSNEEVCEGAA